MKRFKYQFYRGLFVICNHSFGIIGRIQSENLVQVFSLHYSVRYYWVNRLNIAINSVPKYGDKPETTKCPNTY